MAFNDFEQIAPGSTQLVGGSLKNVGILFLHVNGGTLTGSGTLYGDVQADFGSVEPGGGATPGSITVTGSAHFAVPLIVDLYANNSTGKLIVQGDATFGAVRLKLMNGYDPADGDTFTNVVTAASLKPVAHLYPTFGYNNTGQFIETLTATTDSYRASIPVADLALSESVGAPSATTYPVTVTVQNLGSAAYASGIQVALSAANGSIVGTSSSTFTCTGSGASATCTIFSISNASSATITVNVSVPSGTATLSANVTASQLDPNTANNSATASVPAATITPLADVSIVKHAPPSAAPGGSITYNIDVTNFGPSDAANVVVTDPTPSGLTFASLSGGCSNFPCSLGTLAAGQTKTLSATYTIDASLTGIVNNTASVASATADPATANNRSHAFTTLTNSACTPPIPPEAPAPSVVASALSGQTYDVQWPAVDGAIQYEIDEATDANFTSPSTQSVTTTVVPFAHSTQSTQTYYYRVRALAGCGQVSAYSPAVQVIIAPPARRRAVRP